MTSSEFIIPEQAQINYSLLPQFKALMDNKEAHDLRDEYILGYEKKDGGRSLVEPKLNFENLLAEGSGTRGGGSGILTDCSNGRLEVTLLDVYRSENSGKYTRFYKPDSKLRKHPVEQFIFNEILKRAHTKFPSLVEALKNISVEIPFSKWTASVTDFPVIDDYIGDIELVSLDHFKQSHVQIAYRHLNQIIYNEYYYNLMDSFNKTALRLHEYIYMLSGQKKSIYTQILVSYLMSEEIMNNSEIPDEIFKIHAYLGFSRNSYFDVVLPENVLVSDDLSKSDKLCGYVTKLERENSQFHIKINFEYDVKRPQLSRYDIYDLDKILQFNFDHEHIIDITDQVRVHQFFMAFGYGVFYLHEKFPKYLYPAQSKTKDVVCVYQSNKNEIYSLEKSIRYDPEKNKLEIDRAALEAQYFKLQREYMMELKALKNRQEKNREHKIKLLNEKFEFLFLKLKAEIKSKNELISARSSATAFKLYHAKELGGISFLFGQ